MVTESNKARYEAIKTVFKKFGNTSKCEFFENDETKLTKLTFSINENKYEYYYSEYSNSVCLVVNDDDVMLLVSNPEYIEDCINENLLTTK